MLVSEWELDGVWSQSDVLWIIYPKPNPWVVLKDRDDEDEDWAEETTEEAQRRRMEEISNHAKNLTLTDDLEKTLEERVNLFYSFVKVHLIPASWALVSVFGGMLVQGLSPYDLAQLGLCVHARFS